MQRTFTLAAPRALPRLVAYGLLAAVLASGCAAKAPASDKLVAAREAIARAAQAGGDTYASADMLSARSGLERAQAALQKGEMASARSQTEQAVVDAQLAEAKVRSAKAQAAAAALRDSRRALEAEVQRNQN